MSNINYFSMFSGIGGFEVGIFNASQAKRIQQRRDNKDMPIDRDSSLASEPLCIGYSEIDKYAIQIYEKHFKEHKNYGDCTKIDWNTVQDFDLLVGGFPCQAFSIAGKRHGFTDTRGTLFFEIARCLKEKQPRLCLLENVKGLLSHDKGSTYFTILSTLDELGYDCQWQVLNSKDFGVPQNRERVFIVGYLGGERRPEVFPIEGTDGKTCKILGRITGPKGHDYLRRVYDKEFSSPTLPTKTGGGHIPKISPTIDGCSIRRLTPTECERLQGFPDGWTTEGSLGPISDSQRYKCLGNAVTTNVITAIMERLI